MKTFHRANLPKSIRYNKKEYLYDGKNKTEKSIRVLVLSTRLRGKSNLWGKPYKPSEFFLNPV